MTKENIENKYVLGAYINLALHNFELAIVHLHQLIYKGDKLPKKLDDEGKETKEIGYERTIRERLFAKNYNNLIPIIDSIFPFMKSLVANYNPENEINFYKEVLAKLYHNLTEIRNEYTHYYHDNFVYEGYKGEINPLELELINLLQIIYDGSVNTIKERFGVDEQMIIHLQRKNKKGDKKDFRYRFDNDNDNKLSEKGVAFLMSLFLNKKYAFLFLKKLKNFKDSTNEWKRMTLEAYTCFSIRLPITKMDWEKNDNYIVMDAINELSKVPYELFKTLSYENQEQFRISDNEDDFMEGSRIRQNSRFEYFATTLLPKLYDRYKEFGFYTYFGNFYKDGYKKTICDGVKEDRYLTEHVCGFTNSTNKQLNAKELEEKLGVRVIKSKDEDSKDEKGKDNISELNTETKPFKPLMTYCYPHIIVNNNNIGIRFLENNENIYPKIDIKKRENKEDIKSVINIQPQYWLSIYELPALLYYAEITENRRLNEEKNPKIKKCKSVREIIENATKRVKTKTFSRENSKKLMIKRIKKYNLWGDRMLNIIEKSEAKKAVYGKKQYVALRDGKIAEILMKDIIWLQPSLNNGRDKVTGANYQGLQRSLAGYIYNINSLKRIFTTTGLINSENAHPFLKNIDPLKHYSLIAFFSAYLKEREKYFKNISTLIENDEEFDCYILRDLKETEKPIMLPRGLFTEAIKNATKGTNEKQNVSYIIRNSIGNELQPFYSLPRKYKLFEDKELSLEDRIKQLKTLKPEIISTEKAFDLTDEERRERNIYNEVCDNESLIRFREVQDIVLFSAVKLMLERKVIETEKGTPFENLYLSKINNLLSEPVKYSQIIGKNGYKIVTENIKIKDFGKLKMLASSSKIITLISYLEKIRYKKELPYNEVLTEVQSFEEDRVEITKLSQELEKIVIGKFGDIIKKEKEGGYYNFRAIIEYLYDSGKIKIEDINNLYGIKGVIEFDRDNKDISVIRNMYMHSSYKADIAIDTDKLEISKNYVYIYNRIIEYIKSVL